MSMPRSIEEASKLLNKGDLSSEALVDGYLKEIERVDHSSKERPGLHAFLEVFDDAREEARHADERRARGERGELLGIPIALKDNILSKEKCCTAGSKILEGYVAPYDATVVEKLRERGAVIIGRTNMDEFAMGSSTENSAFGPTLNPHDHSRVPGGSSGGSAAAVAAGMCLGALGSDTGGSIRQPAGFCGIVGLKPTYGRVSRYGLIAMASSLDQIGPLARTVGDAERLFRVISGKDGRDMTSRDFPIASKTPRTIRIGVLTKALGERERAAIDEDVLRTFDDTVHELISTEGGRFDMTEITTDLSLLRYSLPAYYVIVPAEASTNLARFDGVKYGYHASGKNLLEDYLLTRGDGFGKEVRRRILIGTYVLSSGYYDAYYGKAVELMQHIRSVFRRVFEDVDLIATPTSPTPAFYVGERTGDPLSMYLADIFTVTANIAGLPAISVPAGSVVRDGKKLPLGIQFMAPWGREDLLFEAGRAVEERMRPSV